MKRLFPLALISLVGCAGTAASVYEKPAQQRIVSAKTPQSFANCAADNLSMTSLRNDGDHYWLVSQFGISAIIRWDFTPRPEGGSVAELRSSTHIGGSGEHKVQSCA